MNIQRYTTRALKAIPMLVNGRRFATSRQPLLSTPVATGKYMVTAMAEGYRLCGGYFEILEVNKDVSTVDVRMVCQLHPLPLGTIRMFIFEDSKPCNGQYDPGELPLGDFGIGINDIEGPITEDYYGNSLLELASDPVTGMIEVPNMWPGRYDLDVGPPPYGNWVKTNTLEGGHGWDYWCVILSYSSFCVGESCDLA
jgi:hypothetical protein